MHITRLTGGSGHAHKEESLKRGIHVLASLAVVALLVSMSVGVAGATRVATPTATLSLPPQGECPGWCFFCDPLENLYIVTPNSVVFNDSDTQTNCGHHTPCQFECRASAREDIERVTRVVASSDETELRKLLGQVAGLSLNAERRALQLEGCKEDQIVLHLPLTDRQIAAIGASASTRAVVNNQP